jgi:septum site-determining protein MinC
MGKNDVLIKGTKEGIHLALGEGEDYLTLRRHLQERLRAYARYFHGMEVTLEIGRRRLTPSQLRELEDIITKEHGMRVLRVRGAWEHEAPPSVRVESRSAGVVRRSLRSGQRVLYDGTVVVYGDVHAGAEVVATGDVVVLGTLAGLAHAGARGSEEAVVAALRLVPTQIRIASRIGRPPEGDGGGRGAEIARVRDGQIVVEPYPLGVSVRAWLGLGERRERAWAKSS